MKKLIIFCTFATLSFSAIAEPLPLKKGDHICIIGNTLADRMQHSGYLEALIHAKFPQTSWSFEISASPG